MRSASTHPRAHSAEHLTTDRSISETRVEQMTAGSMLFEYSDEVERDADRDADRDATM